MELLLTNPEIVIPHASSSAITDASCSSGALRLSRLTIGSRTGSPTDGPGTGRRFRGPTSMLTRHPPGRSSCLFRGGERPRAEQDRDQQDAAVRDLDEVGGGVEV